MRYTRGNRDIRIGDSVIADGSKGLIICDFERWECMAGYEDWLTKEQMLGGGYLSSGVLVKTEDFGLIHYPKEDESIDFVAPAGGGD